MIIIGITGNTGAGKTTVSTIIKNNTNALVIDADELAKSLMEPGKKYYNDVVELFGEEIVLSKPAKHKGKINRAKLAKKIFNDDEKRLALNKLTYKHLGKEIKQIILENKNQEIIVLDVPLLFESGFNKICNYVIVVSADEEAKIDRVKQRDKIHPDQIRKRLSTQKEEEELKQKADFVIKNTNGTRYISLVKDTIKVVHEIKKLEEEKKAQKIVGA
jgi:dephospho-CoA kinase